MTTAIGTRVRLTQDVENYPGIFKAGLTGTLVEITSDSYWIELDEHFPVLEEWDNRLQVWDFSDLNDGKHHPESYIERIEI